MRDPLPVEISQMWLRRARSDLRLGEVALSTPDVMLEDACFHAQQYAEKALKAILAYLEIPFPRTHAIDVLLDLLAKARVDIPSRIDEAFSLTQYAVQTRYPGVWETINREETEKAILVSGEVLKWVEKRLSR